MAGPALHHALEAFATYLRVERNLAPRTREAYAYDLKRFEGRMKEVLATDPVPLRRIGPAHLGDYLGFLSDEQGNAAARLNRVVSSLRVFFAFCLQEKMIERNPARDLRAPKLPQRLPIYLVKEELEALFGAPDRATPLGRRDYAMLVTLAYTGVRLKELVGLNTRDVDFSRETIVVYGKGRKERIVPLNYRVVEALRGMLEDPERVVAGGEAALFLNARGKRLTGRAVQQFVDKYVAAAAVGNDRISPHKLRHSFATLLYSKDTDLIDIQALMGHASLTSTQIYTHTDSRRLKKTVDLLDFDLGD